MRHATFVALLAIAAGGGRAYADEPQLPSTLTPSITKTVEFAPGVRIDWSSRTVAVQAKVALRQGPLELLACAPQSREHESVLVVSARPLHIYQAVGLLGAEPGQPPLYDEKTQRVKPPHGGSVSLAVRFGEGSAARELPSRELFLTESGEAPKELRWVFSGSQRQADGGLAADTEGTVACVVDFSSALLSLDRSHSASNDQLWLSANTSRIPPVGTGCELLIRIDESSMILITLDAQGQFGLGGRIISATAIAKIFAKEEPQSTLHIVAARASFPAPSSVGQGIQRLVNAGIGADRIETKLPRSTQPE